MSVRFQATLLALVTSVAAGAHADPRPQKQPLQVDFNKMIDENNIDRGELARADESAPAKEISADRKKKVIDFVDMEVGVGTSKSVGRN